MVHVIMRAAFQLLWRQKALAKILCRMRHQPIRQRVIGALIDLLRLRTKNRRTGNDDLLADTDQKVCICAQQGVDQIKMLDHDALAAAHGQPDRIRELTELMKAHLKADVHMIGMRGKKAGLRILVEDRQRAHVDAIVIVGQLKTREHPFDQHAFS